MAQEAAYDGDVAAAERWLALTSERSEDLRSHTAHCIARALIATRVGNFGAVLQALGRNAADVPIADEEEALCVLLRANAFEQEGKEQDAVNALLPSVMVQDRERELARLASANAALELCPRALAAAEQTAAELLNAAPRNPHNFVGVLILIAVCGLLFALMLGFLAVLGVPSELRVLAGVATFLAAFVGGIVRIVRRRSYVEHNGTRCRALVLSAHQTMGSKDGQPDYSLLLLVYPPNEKPYAAHYRQSGLGKSQTPGNWIPLMVHPTNRNRMVAV
jgi:hypothetical protein